MRLDTKPFPANVNVVDFEGKKVLVHPEHANTTKGKSVVMSDEPRVRMLKPCNPELGEWKVNWQPIPCAWVKPTSDMLLEKYTRQHRQLVFQRLGGMVRTTVASTLSVRLQHVGVGIIRVLVNHPGTRAGEELPGRWVCWPENWTSTEVGLVRLMRRWTARRCTLLGSALSVGSPHHKGLAGWFRKRKQMRPGADWEPVMG
jgi:hypothetical protein